MYIYLEGENPRNFILRIQISNYNSIRNIIYHEKNTVLIVTTSEQFRELIKCLF